MFDANAHGVDERGQGQCVGTDRFCADRRNVNKPASGLGLRLGECVHKAVENLIAHEGSRALGDFGSDSARLQGTYDAFDRQRAPICRWPVRFDDLLSWLFASIVGNASVHEIDGNALRRNGASSGR